MHYIQVYKELLKLVDIGHEKMKTASMDFLFIEILKREVDKFHLRLIELKEAGKIELFDSLKNEPIICTLSEVNKMYEKVCALYSFNHLENNDYLFF